MIVISVESVAEHRLDAALVGGKLFSLFNYKIGLSQTKNTLIVEVGYELFVDNIFAKVYIGEKSADFRDILSLINKKSDQLDEYLGSWFLWNLGTQNFTLLMDLFTKAHEKRGRNQLRQEWQRMFKMESL